jgi:SPP1 gp7 family putative phage head morphogenesis protein
MMKFMDRELFPDMKRILERRLGNIGNGAGRGAWTTARYKQMLKVLDEQINTGFRFMSQEAKARLTRVGMAEAKWAQSSLQQTVPLNVGFNTVDMNTVRSIVSSKPFQGALLKDWYKELGTRFKGDLRKALNIGLASGESIPQITARVMGIRGVEQGFTGSSLRAQMRRKVRSVVRTSSSHVAAKTRSAVYAENSDIIAKVRWVATLDNRTTDICQSLDGQEWKVGQEQTPPAHHQCRSTTVPVTKTWKQLGLNAKDKRVGGRAFRDVKTGLSKVSPTHMNYGDWLLKQPADVQNQILGTGRANLLRDGVKFSRFFSNGRALSVDEILALEGVEGGVATVEAVTAEAVTAEAVSTNAMREELATLVKNTQDEFKVMKNNANLRIKEAGDDLYKKGAEYTDEQVAKLAARLDDEVATLATLKSTEAEAIRKHVLTVFGESAESRSAYGVTMQEKGLMFNTKSGKWIKSIKSSPAHARKAEDALDFVNRVIPKNVSTVRGQNLYDIDVYMGRSTYRANYNINEVTYSNGAQAQRGNFLAMSKGNDVGVYVHEISHSLEYANATVSNNIKDLFRAMEKIGREQYKKIGKLDPRYGTAEARINDAMSKSLKFKKYDGARKMEDGFELHGLSGYMGKVYNRASSEMVTMFMEGLYRNPTALLRSENKALFNFMMDVIKGRPVNVEKVAQAMVRATEKSFRKNMANAKPNTAGYWLNKGF